MADSTKKKPTKYKFGQRELDLNEYLQHIGNNVQSYIDDRKKKRGWTDDLVQEFSNSYGRYMKAFQQQLADGSNRFSTDDLGSIIDTNGEFSNIDDDGIDPSGSQFYYNDKGERITTDDYNLLKDKKKKNYKTFNANREVAKFFNIIGKGMKDIKPEEREKFDLGKHGFFSWWKQKYNPAGGAMNLKPFLDKDPVGADGKRPVVERAKMAAGWMGEYLDWLKGKDLDYSGYEQFPDYDTYAARGNDLKNKWGDGKWDADDLIAGQAFGIDNKWSDGFFTTEEDPNLTPELREEAAAKAKDEEEKKKQEDLKKSERDWIDQQYRIYTGSNAPYSADNPFTRVNMNLAQWYGPDNSLLEENYLKAWDAVAPDLRQSYMDRFVQDPFNAMYSKDMSRNIVGLIQEGLAQQIGGEGELAGKYYIPSKSDVARRRALIYDPTDHSMYYTFIGDVPHVWDKLHRSQFKEKNGLVDKYDKYSKLENGGILSMQVGGDFGNKLQQRRDRYIAAQAAAKGVSTERYENDMRQPNGEANLLNPNNGEWTAADKTHAASLLADLTAMGLGVTGFTPASAISGAVGTTGHLTADIMEDGLDWGDVGRAAVGYGLDALALIPGGGTFSQGAKIAKTVAKMAPRALAVLGTMGAVANIGPITNSFKKAMSSGPENKLTVEDYRNITQGLTLILGGGAAAGRKFHQVRNFPVNNRRAVAVQLRNKNTGEIETRAFFGEDANALKSAKDNKAMLDIIFKDNPGLADYELVANKSLLPRLGKIKSDEGWFKQAGFRDKKARVMQIRQDSKGNIYAENGNWKADIDSRHITGATKGEIAYQNQLAADDAFVASQLAGARRAADYYKNVLPGVKTRAEQAKTLAENDLATVRSGVGVTGSENAATLRGRQQAIEKFIKGDGSTPTAGYDAARAELANLTRQTRTASANYRSQLASANKMAAKQSSAKNVVKDLQRQLALKQKEVAQAHAIGDTASEAALQVQADAIKANLKTAQNTLRAQTATTASKYNTAKTTKDNRNSLKSKVLKKQKDLNENTQAKADEYKTKADTLEKAEKDVANATSRLDKLTKLLNDGHTQRYRQLEAKTKEGKITFKDASGREITREFADIVKKYGLMKEGGKFSNVRSFKPGGGINGNPIRNVQGNANWFEHMYKHDSMTKWLDSFTQADYKKFNALQDSWLANKNSTGYDPNHPDMARGSGTGRSEDVWNRQAEWNQTGTNAAIEDLRLKKILTGRGGTGDTAEGQYQDGYFGAQEFLRHGGTKESWEGHDEDLKKLQAIFKEKNLDYSLDDDGMYRLHEINPDEQPQDDTEKDPSKTTISNEEDKQLEEKKQGAKSNVFNTVRNFASDMLPIAGLMDATTVNNTNTARSIDAARRAMNLKDPFQKARYYMPNTKLLQLAERYKGLAFHAASQPMTSDGNLLTAAYMDTVFKGLEGAQQFVDKYNASADIEKLAQVDLLNENAYNRHITKEANDDIMSEVTEYIANAENARDQLNYLNRRAFMAPYELENSIDRNTRKAKAEQAQLDNLFSGIMNNPTAYGIELSDKELEVWNKRMSGEYTSIDDIKDPEEVKALRSAQQKITEGYYMVLQQMNGVPLDANFNNRFNRVRGLSQNESTDDDFKPKYKDGSKINIAKIRARSKDADRVAKGISKSHDRAAKDRERIDRRSGRRAKLKDYK